MILLFIRAHTYIDNEILQLRAEQEMLTNQLLALSSPQTTTAIIDDQANNTEINDNICINIIQQSLALTVPYTHYNSDSSDTIPQDTPAIIDVAVVKGKRGLGIGLKEENGAIIIERSV